MLKRVAIIIASTVMSGIVVTISTNCKRRCKSAAGGGADEKRGTPYNHPGCRSPEGGVGSVQASRSAPGGEGCIPRWNGGKRFDNGFAIRG